MKPKVAFFSFTSCEGCQLSVLDCEKELVDMFSLIEVVNFREVSSFKNEDYEIAFIEGAISRESEIDELTKIRQKAKIIVALGACSVLGGVNCLKNFHKLEEIGALVYGGHSKWFDTIEARPIHTVIKVDYLLRGCPIDKDEFLTFLKQFLLGAKPKFREFSVCFECKQLENVCLFEKGSNCLGPVIMAGCKAICPSFNQPCDGCRGMVSEPNLESLYKIMQDNGFSHDIARLRLQLYNGYEECIKT